MTYGFLALTAAALFTGAAFYVNFAEHPARLSLDDASARAEWVPAYKRGALMQASLALIAFLLGAAAFLKTGQWRWLAGGVLMLANWPYTFIAIMPTNRRLMAMAPEGAGPESRRLLTNWNQLHMVRTGLGAVATTVFLWAASGG